MREIVDFLLKLNQLPPLNSGTCTAHIHLFLRGTEQSIDWYIAEYDKVDSLYGIIRFPSGEIRQTYFSLFNVMNSHIGLINVEYNSCWKPKTLDEIRRILCL